MKGMVFGREGVEALLDKRKTMTRRIMNPQPPECIDELEVGMYAPIKVNRFGDEESGKEVFGVWSADGEFGARCPYPPGMRVYVKETWNGMNTDGKWWHEVKLPLDEKLLMNWAWTNPIRPAFELPPRWISGRFMPKAAARIWLDVVNVRVERLKDISDEDIVREGISTVTYTPYDKTAEDARRLYFYGLWESLHVRDGFGLNANPMVWVYELKAANG